MARNKFAGSCADCGKIVLAGEGNFERSDGAWRVRNIRCVAAVRQSAGKPLSDAQAASLRRPA